MCVYVATSGAGKLKSRFENMAKTAEEENRKRAEEERARRQARERREKEEAQKRQEVKTHTQNILNTLSTVYHDVIQSECFHLNITYLTFNLIRYSLL